MLDYLVLSLLNIVGEVKEECKFILTVNGSEMFTITKISVNVVNFRCYKTLPIYI